MLINIEGIDGVGKTTSIQVLVRELRRRDYPVESLCEPTHGPHGQALRDAARQGTLTPKGAFDLLLKDRISDVEDNINPALMAGKIVLMDRYFYSHVYQAAAGLDLNDLLAKKSRHCT